MNLLQVRFRDGSKVVEHSLGRVILVFVKLPSVIGLAGGAFVDGNDALAARIKEMVLDAAAQVRPDFEIGIVTEMLADSPLEFEPSEAVPFYGLARDGVKK